MGAPVTSKDLIPFAAGLPLPAICELTNSFGLLLAAMRLAALLVYVLLEVDAIAIERLMPSRSGRRSALVRPRPRVSLPKKRQ